MEWGCALILLAIFFAGTYLLSRYQTGPRAAFKRLPIVFSCVATAFGVVALFRLLPSEWRNYALSGLMLSASLFIWVDLPIRLNRIARSGEILLDMGRPPGGLAIGFTGVFFGLLACVLGILQAIVDEEASAATRVLYVSLELFSLTTAAYLCFLWSRKQFITERGIMMYLNIFKWEKIEYFRWCDSSTLVLRIKKRFSPWRDVYARVALEKKEAATEILERYLSADAARDGAG